MYEYECVLLDGLVLQNSFLWFGATVKQKFGQSFASLGSSVTGVLEVEIGEVPIENDKQ